MSAGHVQHKSTKHSRATQRQGLLLGFRFEYQLCYMPSSLKGSISNAEARQPGKAPNFSVNWTAGDQGLEVVNATTGKDDLDDPLSSVKHALYSRWVRLHAKLSQTLRISVDRPATYHEAKQGAAEYHTAKQTLIKAFQKAGLGAWVKKPIEQDQFSLNQ
ncbi:hypothetical protein AOLI_G00290430 [Acnodon oligacanthus]